jgi:quercetin dioxygenase-like cupin family protein
MAGPGRTTGRRHRGAIGVLLVGVAISTLLIGCGSGDGGVTSSSAAVATVDDATPVVRTRLGQVDPESAPGQTMYLEEVVIAPGARLATHFHEGTQVARVISGRLTYNIVSGPVTLLRSGGEEIVEGPAVVTLEAGEGVVETSAVTHFGANDGSEPVVIMLAALLAQGAPMATAVEE